jgi:DNA ligase-1
MLLSEVADVSREVGETPSRLRKVDHLAACLRRLPPEEVDIGLTYLTGELPQGRIGVGPAALRLALSGAPAPTASLTLVEVDRAFTRVAEVRGSGSSSERLRLLSSLLSRATRREQDFLARLVLGELRQGALEGVLLEAVAQASGVSVDLLRRALTVAGNLRAVARAALEEGPEGLGGFALRLFQPLQPMLAQTAEDPDDALGRLGRARLEWKFDGARVQIHKAGGDVRVFTRSLHDVTASVPELVELAQGLPAGELVLDGEALALLPDGTPQPFQVTMRRFGRKKEVERLQAELPLAPFFFDCLYLDGESLVDRPAAERFGALTRVLPERIVVPHHVTEDAGKARAFLEEALRRGHEGILVKSLGAAYEAGRRGFSWLKVKPAHTLDLVILAAEWGHGRRHGWLSNLHLGARDPEAGSYVMLGKTFKGLTDEMLAWQTKRLLEVELARDDWAVYVRPELVAEIAFDEVQASPRYTGGLALRLARVKRYRPDKRPEDADTIGAVRAIFEKRVLPAHT